MSKNFFPRADLAVKSWSSHFRMQITESRELLHLTQDQVDRYALLDDEFATRLAVTSNRAIRCKSNVEAKNTALRELEIYARELAALVRARPDVTDEMRINLGIGVRKAKSRSVEPVVAPAVTVNKVVGQAVTVFLWDEEGHVVRIPRGAKGGSISTWVGEDEPGPETKWSFMGNTTRAVTTIEFPGSLPIGTRVWIIAQWFGPRGQPGPASKAVSTVLLGQSMARAGRILRAA
ncbi:MAG TPA: hypothetical protein PK402_10200 [Tepidisphaeraceae bacterium]|nr:hypothetical protein [Tepidisphaeraceae bacterium]